MRVCVCVCVQGGAGWHASRCMWTSTTATLRHTTASPRLGSGHELHVVAGLSWCVASGRCTEQGLGFGVMGARAASETRDCRCAVLQPTAELPSVGDLLFPGTAGPVGEGGITAAHNPLSGIRLVMLRLGLWKLQHCRGRGCNGWQGRCGSSLHTGMPRSVRAAA